MVNGCTIWNELSQKPGLKEGYAGMVGNVPRLTQFVSSSTNNDPNVTHSDTSTTVDYAKNYLAYSTSILVFVKIQVYHYHLSHYGIMILKLMLILKN